ncbi:MAG TPA: hypothetical protein VFR01_02155, partial [Geobacterales bacterium]|nr:hypothetical protein [Geobacterales bacterium]
MGNGIYRLLAMATLLALVVTGCGGGSTVNVTPQNSIGGVFSAGNPVASGTVSIYAINADGSKGNLLTQVSTDSHGSYTALIGTYSGPILMEGSGSFTDPASGNTTVIPASAPLRAALPAASEIVTMAVTPVTELAVREAYRLGGGVLTATAISQANDLIGDLFKVEITTTQP